MKGSIAKFIRIIPPHIQTPEKPYKELLEDVKRMENALKKQIEEKTDEVRNLELENEEKESIIQKIKADIEFMNDLKKKNYEKMEKEKMMKEKEQEQEEQFLEMEGDDDDDDDSSIMYPFHEIFEKEEEKKRSIKNPFFEEEEDGYDFFMDSNKKEVENFRRSLHVNRNSKKYVGASMNKNKKKDHYLDYFEKKERILRIQREELKKRKMIQREKERMEKEKILNEERKKKRMMEIEDEELAKRMMEEDIIRLNLETQRELERKMQNELIESIYSRNNNLNRRGEEFQTNGDLYYQPNGNSRVNYQSNRNNRVYYNPPSRNIQAPREGASYEELLQLDKNNVVVTLPDYIIDSIPEKKATGKEKEECPICLNNYEINDTISILPCLHKFHKKCIGEWLKESKKCPICQKDIEVLYKKSNVNERMNFF